MERLEMKKGFTLLELLIVIAIIAILSAILIFVLNPAETLQKGRDSQRISDLATMNSTLGLLLTVKTDIQQSDLCTATTTLYISSPLEDGVVPATCTKPIGFTSWGQVSSTELYNVDKTGWIPVNLSDPVTGIAGGSPIAVLPVDPSNNIDRTTADCPEDSTERAIRDLYYAYACSAALTWEMNAGLESQQFSVTDKRDANDGGNDVKRYEIGTDLTLITP